jgi:hypothetical protein
MVDSLQSLEQMQVHLAAKAESVSIRGAGAASFLFAKHLGRAVEISNDDGMWWIEEWELNDDEDSPPCADARVQSLEEAVSLALAWLLRSDTR